MINNLYSVKDTKSGRYWTPFTDQTDKTALRTFAFQVNTEGTYFHFAPNDFDLYCIGAFDDETGMLLPSKERFIGSGSAVYDYAKFKETHYDYGEPKDEK